MTSETPRRTRRVVVVDDSALAQRIGSRIRAARVASGKSQRELAGERFTSQYISSLERGAVKPSMAALNYLADRLGLPVRDLMDQPTEPWTRLAADVELAAGNAPKAADLYRDLLETAPTPTARAEALAGLAESLCRLNRGADAISPAAEAAELFEHAGRHVDAVWANYWLASAHYQSDNVRESRTLLEALLARVRTGLEVESGFKLRLLTALASVVGWVGEHREALALLEEGRGLVGGLDARARAAYFYSLAQNYKNAGDLEAAVRNGQRSLALYEQVSSELEIAVLQNHLALTYLRLGNLERADEYAAMAVSEASGTHDLRAMAWVTETRAQIALAKGQPGEAIELADEVLNGPPDEASPETIMSALITSARAYQSQGNPATALERWERAADLARAGGSPARRRQVLSEMAEAATVAGDEKRALALYREATQP